MQFAQLSDRVEIDPAEAGPIDASALPGSWINSNPDTQGIARIVIRRDGRGSLTMQAFAVGPEGLIDWGSTAIDVCAATPASRVAAGFTASYDFGFAETRLQGMIMKGLLVLAILNTFKDDSGRAAYFVREYFALEHGRFQTAGN